MKLEDLEIYLLSMQVSDEIWNIVIQWPFFEKNGIGKQWTDAADSISANISEGYGRLSVKENKRFCMIARGSLYETTTWLNKSSNRKLIDIEIFNSLNKKITDLNVKL
ncbi:four helix bundle protein [Gaoshiqia sediminis]|uniref:Four helix bundle protein n=1 Tax=Gaoshiqia sediminis TaxID=2986998 RepID=A0AA41Y0J2_9BACT|nr:four helix bundle protein [Gaoshiqia sediminis]MCW0481229.1 four helix bundle protein [Gaoshiqia sediminis]